MAEYEGPVCATCRVAACDVEPGTKPVPQSCPMATEPELLRRSGESYLSDSELARMAREAARTEAAGYCQATRVEETMDFARRMGWRRLGIAHCMGLMNEAKIAREIFLAHGFEVFTACCKAGSFEKTAQLGIDEEEKVHPGTYEAMCNPVGQAALLAEAGTELNVLMGLCVGHDSIFFMHSRAPVTVLVVKDRVLAHNPVAALYTSGTYYRKLFQE